jgi:Flp pilus assembly protein TadB
VTSAVLAGALFGFGVFLSVRGLRPVPTTTGPAGDGGVLLASFGERVGATARRGAAALRLDPGRRHAAHLAVVGRSAEEHAARCVLAGVWLAGVVVGLAMALRAGGVVVPGAVLAGGAVTAALAGPLLAGVVLRADAAERRDDLLVDLGAYSDLVVLLLAAGSGIEGALTTAADAGDDWTWRRLREALRNARLTRQTPSEALTGLGRRLGVAELEEFGAAIELASASGSRLRESLAARSEALRARELARVQAQAASATERMTFPVVALAVGFLVVLGFPALSKVLSGF